MIQQMFQFSPMCFEWRIRKKLENPLVQFIANGGGRGEGGAGEILMQINDNKPFRVMYNNQWPTVIRNFVLVNIPLRPGEYSIKFFESIPSSNTIGRVNIEAKVLDIINEDIPTNSKNKPIIISTFTRGRFENIGKVNVPLLLFNRFRIGEQ